MSWEVVNPATTTKLRSGLTLLELAFVIGLFGILALFIASRESTLLQTRFDTARQERAISDANTILEASLEFYRQAGDRWPHTATMMNKITIEGLADENVLMGGASILSSIPFNPYLEGIKTAPTVLGAYGVTTLDDMDYMLSGWSMIPGPALMHGGTEVALRDPSRSNTNFLALSFWVASDGPGEARFIAASLPRGVVVIEDEEGGERFSLVQAAIRNPTGHAYLRREWPDQVGPRLDFKDSGVMFDYMQAADSATNPKVALHFGEDMGADYFKLVRLKMDGTSETGVEINFDDLTVPGDLTVEGNLMGNFDFEFMDGVELGGKVLTRDTFCRHHWNTFLVYREVLTAIGKPLGTKGWPDYGIHTFCQFWM